MRAGTPEETAVWRCIFYLPKEIGTHYETQARLYLEKHGLVFLSANFRCRHGEIDLIMREDQQWVFIEVRYRRQTHFGDGIASITHHKKQRLHRAALVYLMQRKRLYKVPVRFDIISIDSKQQFTWIKNAFEVDY